MLALTYDMKIWQIAVLVGLMAAWQGPAADIQLTPGEQATWKRLTKRVATTTPTHKLWLHDGRSFAGWPLGNTTNGVRWAAPLGADGRMVAEFDRAQVKRVEALPLPPNVNYCDVSFQLEFPRLRLIRRPPYSLLTDEATTCVERDLDDLEQLQAAFCARFGTLSEGLGLPDHVQVLIFSEEAAFRTYQRQAMGGTPPRDGFYMPAMLRLALFNQRHASRLEEALEFLAFDSEKRRVRADSDAEAAAIQLRDLAQACDLQRQAERANRQLLRHEGAHQLFHASGLLVDGATPGWLAEGLAQWCEPHEFGAVVPVYAERVKTALAQQRLIPLKELMNYRDTTGHGFFSDDRRMELAYAEAWSLVRLLMRPMDQPGFFNYLRYLRNLDAAADIRRTPQVDMLCRFIGRMPSAMEARWLASIKWLPLDPD